MKTKDKVQKPLILAIDEAEKETILSINSIIRKHNLPLTIYEPIIAKVYQQLLEGKKNEIATVTAQYTAEQEGQDNPQQEERHNKRQGLNDHSNSELAQGDTDSKPKEE